MSAANTAALVRQMRELLSDINSYLEHVGSDGWMTGVVHSDEFHQSKRLIAAADQWLAQQRGVTAGWQPVPNGPEDKS